MDGRLRNEGENDRWMKCEKVGVRVRRSCWEMPERGEELRCWEKYKTSFSLDLPKQFFKLDLEIKARKSCGGIKIQWQAEPPTSNGGTFLRNDF